ncbi:hypothetical protein CCM_02710 [Cordyceps militaris CM01]|uniref:Uncharacterized protein n=2 Tax=Cordyceps militaris TaxID=73501 RepID=G3JBD2_CORMM|nr:uncharacterized protein CCM_02710 [Cordyceps militaris CM01]ATY61155.1 hypothetical protein A9K55_006227 [Cordyceps militaris]EGX94439.1 hypothetical protein CCM_02710 [Cordyceps militaris CM01]
MAPSPAPHERSSAMSPSAPAPIASTANGTTSPASRRPISTSKPAASQPHAQRSGSNSPRAVLVSGKGSPSSASKPDANLPKVVIKKEPGSPSLNNARPRPRKLDLSKNTLNGNSPASALPLTARDGLGIQEVGLACLSPGFVTQNPVMKEQLQRSLSVREQQRNIIEARLQQSAKGDGTHPDRDGADQFSAKTPGLSSHRRRAPPGLSIVAPSHEHFAHERVIQSAPLGHSFTGRHHPAPLSRHVPTQPGHGSQSHIHHVPAAQTSNRLPPIYDVFPHGQHGDSHRSNYGSSSGIPLASPNHPQSAYPAPLSARPREYKSAEDAQQEIAGGRPELLPKIVHYGGHQPPTPPSPVGGRISSSNRRRNRAEYEDGASPPLGHGPSSSRRGPFGAGRDSPESQRAKREEFLRICERAWDLFHS